MAAPATAPTQTDVLKMSDARYRSVVDNAVEIWKAKRASMDKEYGANETSRRALQKALGVDVNNAFVKLVDVNNRYARIAAGGQATPQDKLKYLIQVMELQADIDKNGRRPNSQRVQRLLAQSGATDPSMYQDEAVSRRVWENYITEVSGAPYDPTLLGDVQDLMAKTGWDLNAVQSLEGGNAIVEQFVTRENAATSLNAAADAIRLAFGPDALKTMGTQLAGGGGGIAAAETSMAKIPPDVYDAVREQAKKLPSLEDMKTQLDVVDARQKVLQNGLDADPSTEITAIMSGLQTASARADAGLKQVSFKTRLASLPKFQDWAKSNGFSVGYARKADQPGDKDLASYDSSTDMVYVPGLDDERAFRAASRQAAMGPRAQAFPSFGQAIRGRLPERRSLTIEVEDVPSEDFAKKNTDGKFRTVDGNYATDAEIQTARDVNTVVATGVLKVKDSTGKEVLRDSAGREVLESVVLMKDNSKRLMNSDGTTTPIDPKDPKYADVVFSKLDPPQVPSDAALRLAEAPAPPAAKTRTVIGRETALLPSDPLGATVIETTDGRRVVIPKEKVVSTRAFKEGDVAGEITGTPFDGEKGPRGIRAIPAAIRVGLAGLPTPEVQGFDIMEVGRGQTPREMPASPQAAAVRARVTPAGEIGAPRTAPAAAPAPTAPISAPAAAAPAPALKPVTPTPDTKAGSDVRAGAPSAQTGGTAPKPPAGTAGGTPSRAPVMAGRTIGTSVTPPIPVFGQVAPDVAPPLPAMPMPTASAAPGLFETKNIGFESVAPVARPAAPAAPAAPVPPPVEDDIFAGSSISMDQEEVPSVEPRTDMAAMRARLDAIRKRAQERADVQQAGILPALPTQ